MCEVDLQKSVKHFQIHETNTKFLSYWCKVCPWLQQRVKLSLMYPDGHQPLNYQQLIFCHGSQHAGWKCHTMKWSLDIHHSFYCSSIFYFIYKEMKVV